MMRLHVFIWLMCLGGLACRPDVPAADGTNENLQQSEAASPEADSLARLMLRLTEVEGELVDTADQWWKGFGSDSGLLWAIADFGELAVPALVDCLDDFRSSRSHNGGRVLTVAYLCYEVLNLTAYHEPTDSLGDLVGSWPGIVNDGADTSALRAAQEAWRIVINRRAYVIP